MLADLSQIFSVDLEKLLSGELSVNDALGGNMKKTKFYVCPECGNLIAAMHHTTISCCGKKLIARELQKAVGDERLSVEIIENDYYITSEHEMSREHYISFVALITGDSMILRKQYPEWNLQVRIPVIAHGRLLWCCSQHGLFYQEI